MYVWLLRCKFDLFNFVGASVRVAYFVVHKHNNKTQQPHVCVVFTSSAIRTTTTITSIIITKIIIIIPSSLFQYQITITAEPLFVLF